VTTVPDDPLVREWRIIDADKSLAVIGADHGKVTVTAGGWAAGPVRLDPVRAEKFAQLFVRACWEAAAQDGAP
jgi:hypothetical protein